MRAGFLGEIDLTLPDRFPEQIEGDRNALTETQDGKLLQILEHNKLFKKYLTPLTSMRLRAFELWPRGNAEHRPNSHEEQLESREWMLLTV